jgi:hypothetical protein
MYFNNNIFNDIRSELKMSGYGSEKSLRVVTDTGYVTTSPYVQSVEVEPMANNQLPYP